MVTIPRSRSGERKVRYDAEAVLDTECPGEDRDDAGGCKEPQPEGGEERGDKVYYAIGEPGEHVKRSTEVVCSGIEYV